MISYTYSEGSLYNGLFKRYVRFLEFLLNKCESVDPCSDVLHPINQKN